LRAVIEANDSKKNKEQMQALVSRIKCNTLNSQEQCGFWGYGHVDDALRAPIGSMYNAGALPTAPIFDHMPTTPCCHRWKSKNHYPTS